MINNIKFFFAYLAILKCETSLIIFQVKFIESLSEILMFFLIFFIFLIAF